MNPVIIGMIPPAAEKLELEIELGVSRKPEVWEPGAVAEIEIAIAVKVHGLALAAALSSEIYVRVSGGSVGGRDEAYFVPYSSSQKVPVKRTSTEALDIQIICYCMDFAREVAQKETTLNYPEIA